MTTFLGLLTVFALLVSWLAVRRFEKLESRVARGELCNDVATSRADRALAALDKLTEAVGILEIFAAKEQHGKREEKNEALRRWCDLKNLQEEMRKHNAAAGGFWKTARGEILRIRDMSDRHIQNSIDHLVGRGLAGSAILSELTKEQKRRKVDRDWKDYPVITGAETGTISPQRMSPVVAQGFRDRSYYNALMRYLQGANQKSPIGTIVKAAPRKTIAVGAPITEAGQRVGRLWRILLQEAKAHPRRTVKSVLADCRNEGLPEAL